MNRFTGFRPVERRWLAVLGAFTLALHRPGRRNAERGRQRKDVRATGGLQLRPREYADSIFPG